MHAGRLASLALIAALVVAAAPPSEARSWSTALSKVFRRAASDRRVPPWLSNKKRPIAHRGLHDRSRPELSRTAIAAAVQRGLAVEVDLRSGPDGRVLVFHDERLDRMTNRRGEVSKLTSKDLRHTRLKGTGEPIPTLADVLALVDGKVPLLIEIKGKSRGREGQPRLEAAVWDQLKDYRGEYAVMSFKPHQLRWFRKHAPGVTRGQISSKFENEKLPVYKKAIVRTFLSSLVVNLISRPDFVAYDRRSLPSRAVTLFRELLRKPVVAWTVRSEADRARADPHVDNFIFEQIAAEALAPRAR